MTGTSGGGRATAVEDAAPLPAPAEAEEELDSAAACCGTFFLNGSIYIRGFEGMLVKATGWQIMRSSGSGLGLDRFEGGGPIATSPNTPAGGSKDVPGGG